MAFMGIFYAGAGAGQAAVMVGDASKAKAGRRAWWGQSTSNTEIENPSLEFWVYIFLYVFMCFCILFLYLLSLFMLIHL